MPKGHRIKSDLSAARAARHWSQEQLADASGLSVRTVRRAEASQPVGARAGRALMAVLTPWPTAALSTAALLVGTREMLIDGEAASETVHVVAVPNGWRVTLTDQQGDATWCLSADGLCRQAGSEKELPFATQADAIVAAVCRLEFYRRINHPMLAQRRRRAMDRGARCLPVPDVWNDEFMASLGTRQALSARGTTNA